MGPVRKAVLRIVACCAVVAGIVGVYGYAAHAPLVLVALIPGGTHVESQPVGLRFADSELGKQRRCK